jgi:Predicted membrane protein (DUF2142)
MRETPQDRPAPGVPLRSTGRRFQPHSVFLALAVTFGLAVLMANPPFQAPDEWENFYRAFQVSEGTMVGQKLEDSAGGELPANLGFAAVPMSLAFHTDRKMTRAILDQMRKPPFLDWSIAPRGFFDFRHVVLYAPVGYLPQATGILLGRTLSIGDLGVMYLARLGGFAACVGLGYAALRRMPRHRWSLMLILLVPMNLYLMGSIAQDGLLTGVAVLLVALLARLAVDPGRRPGWREMAVILILAAVLPIAKFVYLPLAALAPLLVLPRLPAWWAKACFATAFVLVCLLPVWAWSHVISSLYIPGRRDIPLDPVAQLHYVAREPLTFLLLVGRTLRAKGLDVCQMFVGSLGWVDTVMPKWFYGTYGLGLLGCLLLESGESSRVRWWHRLAMLGAILGGVFLIYLAMYANWNSVGSQSIIEGIQGRYFLPLAPLLVLGFPPWGARLRAPAWAAPALGTALGTTSAVVCLWAVVSRYYLPS